MHPPHFRMMKSPRTLIVAIKRSVAPPHATETRCVRDCLRQASVQSHTEALKLTRCYNSPPQAFSSALFTPFCCKTQALCDVSRCSQQPPLLLFIIIIIIHLSLFQKGNEGKRLCTTRNNGVHAVGKICGVTIYTVLFIIKTPLTKALTNLY